MRTGENIFKRKDGRWEARYQKGRDSDGKIKYGYCYGKTYTEAKHKVEQAKLESVTATIPAAKCGEKDLGFFCDEWLKLNKPRLRESTYEKYETNFRRYIKPTLGTKLPEALSPDTIAAFSAQLSSQFKLSPKTVKDILVLLHSILEHAAKQLPGKMQVMDIPYPREPKKDIRVLSVCEQALLTDYLLADLDYCKMGVLLSLWTGLRVGEICALRWDHVSLTEGWIRIDATMQRLRDWTEETEARTRVVIGQPKSPSSVRTIPITAKTVTLCRSMVPQSPTAFVLTGTQHYMEPRTLQYHFDRYVSACGLCGVHFHTLRHTFATRCVEAGFEIKTLSEVLGHANANITLNRYVHCSLQLKRENMNKLESVGM